MEIDLTAYLGTLVNFLLAAHGVALVIVNFTDTPKDNEILKKVYVYIEWLAGIIRASKVKQPIE